MNKLKITWQAEDGYVGGGRPHSFNMDADDFDGCETIKEAMALVYEAVEADFQDKVCPNFDAIAIQKQVEELLKGLKP